jgi:hypothetical protein
LKNRARNATTLDDVIAVLLPAQKLTGEAKLPE